ncbi:hypothetical protein [Intestinibacter sp.]|uniref:hypothetical protein n=1 Tax=Intestinibacter sp. TaxID=1965304 RepID=UPI003F153A1E
MKLGVYKNYDISVYGDLDIDVEDYVNWLKGDKPTRENLQKYIEEDFDSNLSITIWDKNLDYDMESYDDISFSGAVEYKLLFNKVEELQNELKNSNTSME